MRFGEAEVEQIHDEEVDTSEAVLRSLLAEQCPAWAHLPARRVDETGTSNTLWRLRTGASEPDVVVRLPRQIGADAALAVELAVLPALASGPVAELVSVPRVAHAGEPSADYPMRWMACEWLPGRDVWSVREQAGMDTGLAESLAAVIRTITGLDGLPVQRRPLGERGGPFPGVLDRLRDWIDDPRWNAERLVDIRRIRRLLDKANELVDATDPVLTHGDLIPGNLLVDEAGRLDAVIDWGGVGVGDPAQDLAPAWAIFDAEAREAFRAAIEADDQTWERGRITELEHAVGGVLYYRPRHHPLGEVMARTLDRILHDA